ncbi:sensor histidine kinase [Haloarcula sediminis]|uniref:sensor histidine kinase n=1 Tax=Haloarcula sediminis TaxID=3111777 RepID=UPI002D76F5AE|nr:PAS domain-containing protein [Haloarcula sp. CK38]
MTDIFHKPVIVLSGTEIIHADDGFLGLIGATSRDSVVGQNLTDFLVTDVSTPLIGEIEALEDGDAKAFGQTVTLRTRTDESREALALLSSVEWDGTTCVHISFVEQTSGQEDIDEHLQDRAMDAAPIGITISDPSQPDNPLIYVNDGFLEHTGYSREDVIGRNCRFLQGEQTREQPVAAMRAAIAAEEPVSVELRNYRKDGSLFWNHVTIVPIRDESGTVTNFLGYQRDITDAKLHEQEKELFKRQAEFADQAMFVTDRDGTIVYVNPAFERQTGYNAAEAVGQTPRILKSDEQDATFYKELWETITAGDIWRAELTNETKQGERYEVEQTIVPILDNREEITHFASIEHDITDRVVKNQTLSVLNRILRHNLRAAITVIEGQAEMLETELDPSERQAAIEMIQRQTDKMRKIADRTSTIRSLADQGGSEDSWDIADVVTLIEEYREQYPAATIDLTVDVEETLTFPSGDLFKFALDEAIDNAVVHAEQVTTNIQITVTQHDTDHIQIRIADNGPGIPENERETIERGTETPLSHGTGVGLWIMRWVTTRLGGTFSISDTDADGATLIFQLPLTANQTPDGSDETE